MARIRLIPGYDVAPGPNRAMVQDPDRMGITYPDHCPEPGPYTVKKAEISLAAKREAARLIDPVTLTAPEDIGDYSDVSAGWGALRTSVKAMLSECITDDHIPKSWPGLHHELDVREEFLEAACDGAATDIAYQEVLARVLLNHEFSEPNKQIAQWARRSKGFIIEWSWLHKRADQDLAWGLSYRRRATRDVFADLQFNPRWFVAYDGARQVGVNPKLVQNIKCAIHDHLLAQNRVNSIAEYRSSRPLFACPAAKVIPVIHKLVANEAESAGLFERTWLEERANHGYPDAWVALEGLRAAARA